MDRGIVYPGAIPLDTDVLSAQRNAMIAIGFLARATLGTTTVVDGLACTQQTVPNMTFNVGQGSILSLQNVDATSYGSLAADTTDPLVKMGINVAPTVFTVTAPGVTGQSVNYLIQAAFSEADANSVILPYYNASNPAVAFSGPGNSGTPQNTLRTQTVNLGMKTGTAATTGSQTTPAPDGGFIGLWVVTVAFGQTSVVTGNIAMVSGAPFVDPLAVGRGVQPGRLLVVKTITTTGAYVPTAGAKSALVELEGGGGAGGGAGVTGASTISAGSGGAAGGWARKFIANITAQTVTIGAGGAGASNANGAAGGTTSFGAVFSATGGAGGTVGPVAGVLNAPFGGAAGGVGTSGDENAVGGHGHYAFYSSAPLGGEGGQSRSGAGAFQTSGVASGNNAVSKGSGGSGGCIPNSSGPATGGNGAPGLCTIWEYS